MPLKNDPGFKSSSKSKHFDDDWGFAHLQIYWEYKHRVDSFRINMSKNFRFGSTLRSQNCGTWTSMSFRWHLTLKSGNNIPVPATAYWENQKIMSCPIWFPASHLTAERIVVIKNISLYSHSFFPTCICFSYTSIYSSYASPINTISMLLPLKELNR